MNELHRNIPQEATNNANGSQRMGQVQRRQFLATWSLRAAGLVGLFEVRDSLDQVLSDLVTQNFHDIRAIVITELAGAALISSRVANAHFNKQRNAIRTNAINKEFQKAFPDYQPAVIPEGYVDQYKDSLKNLTTAFQRRFKI